MGTFDDMSSHVLNWSTRALKVLRRVAALIFRLALPALVVAGAIVTGTVLAILIASTFDLLVNKLLEGVEFTATNLARHVSLIEVTSPSVPANS